MIGFETQARSSLPSIYLSYVYEVDVQCHGAMYVIKTIDIPINILRSLCIDDRRSSDIYRSEKKRGGNAIPTTRSFGRLMILSRFWNRLLFQTSRVELKQDFRKRQPNPDE